METRQVVVFDNTGAATPATLIVCTCGNDTFHIYKVGEHDHVQCTVCDETFCDGTCINSPRVNL